MQAATLVLRDIHQPPAPPWWPPAPGWWLLAGIVLLTILAWGWFAMRRRQHRRAVEAVFDDALRAASTSAEEVAAMSELLRRAARRRDPSADKLQGEDWLRFLDGAAPQGGTGKRRRPKPDRNPRQFTQGPGRLLLQGGYQRAVEPSQAAELRPLARARFLEWMGKR